MKKFDVHEIIEDQDKERKEQIKQKVFSQIDYPVTEEKPKKVFSFKWAALAATSVCALCVAVIVPVLLGGGEPEGNGRYCSQDDYVINMADYTIKDYGLQNNLNIMYFDWYDFAEDRADFVYVNKYDETDVFCVEEQLYRNDTDDKVTLYVTDNRTTMDFLEFYNDVCPNTYEYNGVNIGWGISTMNSFAKFEYKKFRYYVKLDEPRSETVLIEYTKELIR